MALNSCLPQNEVVPSPPATEAQTPLPQRGPARVEVVEIHQIETFPVRVSVIARGNLFDQCTTIDQINQVRNGGNFKIAIDSVYYGDADCPQGPVPFEEVIDLDIVGLPAGIYVVDVNGLQGTFTLRADNVPDQENAVIGGQVWLDSCVVGAGDDQSPTEPPSGCIVNENREYQANGLVDSNESGLGGVVVNLGAGPCSTTGLAATITDENGAYLFSGLKAGTYCITVDTLEEQNESIFTTGEWTYPQVGGGATATAALAPGESNLQIYFGWSPYSVPVVVPPKEECTDKAIFRADVTISDDTIIAAGETFTKTWQLRNIGSCTWDADYGLVFVAGDLMDAQETISLTTTIAPGEDADLSVTMVAPLESGNYRAEWKLSNPDGSLFGIGPGSDRPFWVQIIVHE